MELCPFPVPQVLLISVKPINSIKRKNVYDVDTLVSLIDILECKIVDFIEAFLLEGKLTAFYVLVTQCFTCNNIKFSNPTCELDTIAPFI